MASVHLPEALIVTALLVPLYPALGAAAANMPELRRLVGRGMSVTVTVLTPLSTALAVAAYPAVDVAFGHGAFDADAVAVNVVGEVVLSRDMGAPGIALATSISVIVAGLVDAWLLHRHHAAMPPVGSLLSRAALLAILTWIAGLWLLRAPARTLPWEMLQATRRRR